MTPEAAHNSEECLLRQWKNYWKENQNKTLRDKK